MSRVAAARFPEKACSESASTPANPVVRSPMKVLKLLEASQMDEGRSWNEVFTADMAASVCFSIRSAIYYECTCEEPFVAVLSL